jgi:hypothetical protein
MEKGITWTYISQQEWCAPTATGGTIFMETDAPDHPCATPREFEPVAHGVMRNKQRNHQNMIPTPLAIRYMEIS